LFHVCVAAQKASQVRQAPSRGLTRAAVVSRALFNLAVTAGRRRKPDTPRRILVAHHLLLGDTLMLTPLIAKLRERYPEAEIVMTTPKAFAPLYEKRPYGVNALPFDPRDRATVAALFKQPGFDLAVVPGDNRYSWLAAALGARWIVAHRGDRPAYKNWPVDELIPYSSTPAALADMFAALIDGPPPLAYDLRDWPAPTSAPFTLPTRPYAVLHVGASNPLRLWEPEKWRAVAQWLTEQGRQVVWSGGRNEAAIVAQIDPEQRFQSYAERLDLPQLWQLIANADIFLCPDTGVAHLARLVGTPTVTLFGPGSRILFGAGDFWRNSPYAAVTIDDFPCRDQRTLFRREIPWVRRCARSLSECPAARCMQGIDVERVLAAVASLSLLSSVRTG
jgi:ADP-heptose:LPS heptosyltransferase